MTHLLIVDDDPVFLGIDSWREYGNLKETDTWVYVDHPDSIPEDLSPFDGILLDHRMPSKKGDEVAKAMVERGFSPYKILRISTFNEGDYPAGIRHIGKKVLQRYSLAAPLFAFFAGEITYDDLFDKVFYL